jgi:nitrogen-specific signal transduction histidine kinase
MELDERTTSLLEADAKFITKRLEKGVLCSIRFLTEDRKSLKKVALFSTNTGDKLEKENLVLMSQNEMNIHTVGGDAVISGKIQEVPNMKDDSRFSDFEVLSAGYLSMMAVPIKINKENFAIGVIQVYTKIINHSFSKDDKELVEFLIKNLALILNNQELSKMQKRLEEAARWKRVAEHICSMAHHIGNTLTCLGGFSRRALIKYEEGDLEESKKALELIIKSSDSLHQRLSNLLKLPTETSLLQIENINLGKNMYSLVNFFKTGHSVDVEYLWENDTPYKVSADWKKLEEVFLELLSNANHCGNELIDINVSHYQKHKRNSICVKIRNKGFIPKEIFEGNKLFDPLVTMRDDGTGIGLARAMQIIQAHGGSIKPESKDGVVTFKVYLPL